MIAPFEFSLPARPADEVIRERLDEVLRELADPDVEPAAQAALTMEADKLRRLLRRCFQHGGAR